MQQTKLSMNLEGLESLARTLGNDLVARVGVLGGNNARNAGDGLGNADIGLIHIFGTLDGRIPPRDFLKLPLEAKKRELMKALEGNAAKTAIQQGDYEKAFAILGAKAEEIIDGAFKSRGYGQWQPNAASTIRAKGSSAPLIDTGELRRSITSDVVKKADI